MKRKLNLRGCLGALLCSLLVGGMIARVAGVLTGILSAFALFASAFLPKPATHDPNVMAMGLTMEVWSSRIETNLFKDNEFLMKSVDDSDNVDYKTVHIPQSGAVPNVEINRTIDGSAETVSKRTDQEVTYDIDEYTTDPFIVTNAEEVELSYPKMDDLLSDQQAAINEKVADKMLISWAPTGTATLPGGGTNNNILRSTGIPNNDPNAAVVTTVTYLTGAVGDRKNYGIYDVRQAKKLFDKQNVSKTGRHMLFSADAYDQIVTDMIATKYRDNITIFNPETGELKKLMGFEVHVRSSVVTYSDDATPEVNDIDAVVAADDNDAVLFWQERCVSRAVGDILVYEQKGDPTRYGDVVSALVRAGGAKRRKSEVGVGAIVQAHAA